MVITFMSVLRHGRRITVGNFGILFNGTREGWTSDSLTVLLISSCRHNVGYGYASTLRRQTAHTLGRSSDA